MRTDWSEYTVDQIKASTPSALATGPFGSAISSRFFQSTGIPVLRGSNLSQDVGVRLADEDIVFVSPEKAKEFKRSVARRGDLVFTCWGTIDQVGLIDNRSRYPEYIVSNKQMKLSPDLATTDSLFLYYLFSSPVMKEKILSQGIGSSVPGFNLGQLRNLSLKLPGISEQRAIAHILGTLDDKIEVNRRMNGTLEGIARAIFRSWFVDFEPVRAKAEGRQPEGMDAGTAALFPDAFDGAKQDPIPHGWMSKGLDQIAHYLNGLALQKYPPGDDAWLPVIKISQLRKGMTEGADRASAGIPIEYVINDGDVLFSWSGSLEVALWSGGHGALNQHLFKVTSQQYPKWFYYYWTRHHLPDFQAIAAGKATTMGHIQRQHLSQAKVVVPCDDVLKAANQILGPIVQRVIANSLESRHLADLRDTLLPRLLSGELRVEETKLAVGDEE